MRRAMVSVAWPAGNGTIIRTGRDGYACAHAIRDTAGSAATPAPSCRKLLRGSFILNLPSLQSITRRQERDGVLSGVKPFVCAPTIDWSKKLLVRITSPLGGGDERRGEFLRLVNHHVVAAAEADELPVPIVLVARAELLKRVRLPAGG